MLKAKSLFQEFPDRHVCQVCGRALTDRKSKRLGIGPECLQNRKARKAVSAQRKPKSPAHLEELLGEPQMTFRLDYEGYWTVDAFCTIRVWQVQDQALIVATDESGAPPSGTYRNTNVMNRIERVMFLAWDKIGQPSGCVFAEECRESRHGADEMDIVEFATDPLTREPATEIDALRGKPITVFVDPCWRFAKTRDVMALPS